VLTGGQGSDVFYYDISEKEYGADIIKDFNLLNDKLFIGGFDQNITDDRLAIMSGEEMFGEGWQDLGDSLYKDYVVGIEKLSGDFDAILYLEDVNYSTEEVNLLVNGQEINLPIIKSGQTSLEKEIIFLFAGYNKPKDLINHYSINDKVNLKIKNTDFEESFDVSSIKSVLESAVIQCYVKSLYESL